MAVRRRALEALSALRSGALAGSGEEEDWQHRYRARGGKTRYLAGAAVDHRRVGADAGSARFRAPPTPGDAPRAATTSRRAPRPESRASCARSRAARGMSRASTLCERSGHGAHTAGRLREAVAGLFAGDARGALGALGGALVGARRCGLGQAWRRRVGDHYPRPGRVTSLFSVTVVMWPAFGLPPELVRRRRMDAIALVRGEPVAVAGGRRSGGRAAGCSFSASSARTGRTCWCGARRARPIAPRGRFRQRRGRRPG